MINKVNEYACYQLHKERKQLTQHKSSALSVHFLFIFNALLCIEHDSYLSKQGVICLVHQERTSIFIVKSSLHFHIDISMKD